MKQAATQAGAILFGLLAASAAPAAAQEQGCGLTQLAAIDMTVTPQRLSVPVKLDNQSRMMALRLGQSANQITADAAKTLDLPMTAMSENIHVHREGGEVAYTAKARDFEIGPVKSRNVSFLVLPASDTRPGELAGDIGTRMFEKLDYELDIAGGKFLLFSPDHCAGKVVHWTQTGFATVPLTLESHGDVRVAMQLDGKPVMLGLNTTGSSSIGMEAMRHVFGLDENSPGMTLEHVAPDGTKYYRYGFHALQAGGLNIANPDILVRGEPKRDVPCDGKPHSTLNKAHGGFGNEMMYETTCYAGADGALGLPVLSKLHLYFATREKLLYITGASAK